MNRDELWLLNEKYNGEKTEGFFADQTRLAAGEPLAYIIGHIPFLQTIIYLDSHPLIPRPETEYWTEKAIAEIQSVAERATEPVRVLDLCAGSGCIGVTVAAAIPNTHVTFAEIDPAHLPTIAKNLKINTTIYDSVNFEVLESDLFETVSGSFDFVLSNPPYIDPALDRTERSVKEFEPHQALYGGASGMKLIETIIRQAPTYLTPNGVLYLEHEPEQTDAIAKTAATAGLTITTLPDQYGTQRYTRLTRENN